MTNHLNYPYHRRKDKDYIIITFSDRQNTNCKYCSTKFTKSQVTYLCTSDYIKDATLIEYSYHKMTPDEFYFGYGYVAIDYLNSKINDLQEQINLVNSKIENSKSIDIKKMVELMKQQNKKGESK
jgi:NAD+--asparagine ADP-ribosyltransferase